MDKLMNNRDHQIDPVNPKGVELEKNIVVVNLVRIIKVPLANF